MSERKSIQGEHFPGGNVRHSGRKDRSPSLFALPSRHRSPPVSHRTDTVADLILVDAAQIQRLSIRGNKTRMRVIAASSCAEVRRHQNEFERFRSSETRSRMLVIMW